MPQRCIVIGASAGGFEVLKDLVSRLPAPGRFTMGLPAYGASND
jgi:hypothetical protein